MSKFRNLFKKFSKKNEKDQEFDDQDEFYTDIESEDDLEDYDDTDDIGEKTVIINSEEVGDELIPHSTQGETQIPADSDLKFPELPPERSTAKQVTEEQDNSHDQQDKTAEISLDSLQGELDDILDDTEEKAPENDLNEFSEITRSNDDHNHIENQEESFPEEFEEDYSDEEDEIIETETTSTNTNTNTIDLDEEKISIKDRFDHLKTRALDRVRNFNKKDLNQAFKNNLSDNTTKINLDKIKAKTHNINWANIPKEFFNRKNRPNVHNYFQGTVLIVSIYASAKIIGGFIAPDKNYKALQDKTFLSFESDNNLTRKDIDKLKDARVFRTGKTKIVKNDKPEVVKSEICKVASRKSRASVKLINTIVLQDSVKSIASVQVRSSSKLKNIREGEVLENLRVDKIERLRLVVLNKKSNQCESIESSKYKKSKKAIKVLTPNASKRFAQQKKNLKGIEQEGNNFKIERKLLQNKLKDINSLLTQARGIPINNPDGTISFKIVEIQPDSVFSYLGIEENDIITQINGDPITELNTVMNYFGKVSTLSNLNLTVKRNGEETTQNYNIR